MTWTIDTFYDHPDSPFSDEELYKYALHVHSANPNDSRSQEILRENKEM